MIVAELGLSPAHAGTSGTALAIRVSGSRFVDASGSIVQLRGVNISGLEAVAIAGWSPANPWGAQTGDATPNWNAIKTWKVNTVRLPLNEASWLGYQCVDVAGAKRDPDPGHNYQAMVKQSVAEATAAGLYVILDLHWSAPKNVCPLAQNPMADADNSLNFWTSIADAFKANPAVLFDLFNEPYTYWLRTAGTEWQVIMQGGTMTQYVTGGTPYQVVLDWQVASMQQMLNAVRATGATNVVLVAGVNWAGDLSGWLKNMPRDALKQLAAVWHAYPAFQTKWGTAAYTIPNGGAAQYTYAQAILDAGVPVIITETGDHNAAGTVGSPFVSKLLPWADQAGVSYIGWTWDVWGNADNVLIKDSKGTPSDGYGAYVRNHLLCVATGKTGCP
jgi:endoglucanase